MNFPEYSQLLKGTLIANGRGCLIMVALIVGIIVADWFFDKTVVKRKKRDSSDSKTGRLIFAVLFISLELGLYAEKCLPAISDIKNERYVCVHGEYYMYNYDYSSDKDRDIQVTLDNGEVVRLRLPKRLEIPTIDEERFPAGKFTGTVWYAENSHFILEFIPD